MKSSTLLACLCIITGCSSSSTSQETISQDTVNIVAAASNSLDAAQTTEPPFTVTDSAALALKDHVESQFEKIYQAVADSTNYYKVVYVDYYDEYEGQDELKRNIWYFDKELNIVYSTFSYQNGAMDKPDSTQYITRNNEVISIKNESGRHGGIDNRSFTLWSTETGGLIVNWSFYFKKAESIEPLPKDYVKDLQDRWTSDLSNIKDMIEEEEELNNKDSIYRILIQKPKQSELMDYRELVIPREVYKRVRVE